MENSLTLSDFIKIIRNINSIIQDNMGYLTELDSTIGDSDHGIIIAHGFKNVIKKLEENQPQNISELLKTTGITLMTTMGGASGPIFGSFFSEMTKVSIGKEILDLNDVYCMFLAVLDN